MSDERETVLVTGGTGFIGSHLVGALLKDGHPVVALDDLSTGSLHTIQHLIGHRGFRFELGSVHGWTPPPRPLAAC